MLKKVEFKNLVILAMVILFGLTECAKDLTNGNISNSKLSSTSGAAVIPNLLPGKCPYDCHDTRCKAYANGYCGPATSDSITLITNPNNPDDSVGNRHNAGIRAIVSNYQSGTEPTTQNSWAYTTSYFQKYGYSASLLNIIQDTIENRYDSTIYSMTVNSLATYMYNSQVISSKLYGYMTSLGNLINSLGADTISSANYQKFANGVISLESTIVSDASLSATEKLAILSGTSVARYSCNYWMNYADTATSGGAAPSIALQNSVIPLKASSGGWFSWSTVVGGDVSGAVAGAMGGGAVALLSGGALLPAVGVGAAAGAVSNSAYEAGMQLWHHWFGGK